MAEAQSAHKRAVAYLRVSTTEQAHAADAAEGYSIPAQREACTRKAADLGADVVAYFTDRGESARSTARPELQRMLELLASHKGIDYVIVHKVDRLARNRADDVQIQLTIEKAGAQLVSVTENVDDTPSGRLVRNIMADLAEFYSSNLATEILKGSVQKARLGGTPFKAPVGYRNVQSFSSGRDVRTVELDADKASLVRQAFELYATGEYSLRQLQAALETRGLYLATSKLAKLLRTRYYLGIVVYRGVEYPGNHPALIGSALFDRVQDILNEREQHSLKLRRHSHYLRGLLTCARCGNRLMYTTGRGRGGEFDYYICGRRHRHHTCDLPYISAPELERRIDVAWPTFMHVEKLDTDEVAAELLTILRGEQDNGFDRVNRLRRQLARVEKERLKLLEMAYAEAIPMDLLKSEQLRLRLEHEQATSAIRDAENGTQDVMAAYHQAVSLMALGASAYYLAEPEQRRLLIRAFTSRLEVDADDEIATLASPFAQIKHTAESLKRRPVREKLSLLEAKNTNPGASSEARGSIMNSLVELAGIAPASVELQASALQA